MKGFKVTPVINKKNNQVNISLPKSKLSPEFKKDLSKMSSIDIKIEGWKCDKKIKK